MDTDFKNFRPRQKRALITALVKKFQEAQGISLDSLPVGSDLSIKFKGKKFHENYKYMIEEDLVGFTEHRSNREVISPDKI